MISVSAPSDSAPRNTEFTNRRVWLSFPLGLALIPRIFILTTSFDLEPGFDKSIERLTRSASGNPRPRKKICPSFPSACGKTDDFLSGIVITIEGIGYHIVFKKISPDIERKSHQSACAITEKREANRTYFYSTTQALNFRYRMFPRIWKAAAKKRSIRTSVSGPKWVVPSNP